MNDTLKDNLDKVYRDNFNIYALLNRLKKESKVGAVVPDEVLLKVCDSYWRNKDKIENRWAWFARTVVACWEEYNAEQNIKQGQAYKSMGVIPALRDIMKGI